MLIVNVFNKIINQFGAEIVRYPNNELKRRTASFSHFEINKIFDIGANDGKYGVGLRKLGYKGEIISFEPLSETFVKLKEKSDKDSSWQAVNMALGDFDGESEINIAGNVDSSSLLDMLPSHINSAPESKYIGKENIKVAKLDSIMHKYYIAGDNIYMKIDTQGFEKNVLDGAIDALKKIKILQIEMSIIPLYKDSISYLEMIEFLKLQEYSLWSVEPGFYDKETGRLLQFDGIFVKN